MSRESTPGPYSIYPRVLRLGFDTHKKLTAYGYSFGSLPDCDVQMPYYGKSSQGCYFRIHYNFNSGALLITAMGKMAVGSTMLKKDHSLLVMADTVIDCGGKAYQFMVEFPDLGQCAEAHERHYREYVSKLDLQDALYMATSRDHGMPIGCKHRSKAALGEGGFGEVHKAMHVNTGELCAIKMLPDDEEQDILREIRFLIKLSHVSQFGRSSIFSRDCRFSLDSFIHPQHVRKLSQFNHDAFLLV